jgi:ribonuclease-3
MSFNKCFEYRSGRGFFMDLDQLEAKLGYVFRDRKRLERALSHKSVGSVNNERLEFLGDAALGYVVANYLFKCYPGAAEDDLTLMRANLVKKMTLAEVARSIDLGRYLQLGGGEKKGGGRDRSSILADALEAVLGAIVIDGGIESVASVVVSLNGDRLDSFEGTVEKDPKTRLQELVQSRRMELPSYNVLRTEGHEHAPVYFVQCRVEELDLESTASGTSRREAEKLAALGVLDRVKA